MQVFGETKPYGFVDPRKVKESERESLVRRAMHQANVRYTL